MKYPNPRNVSSAKKAFQDALKLNSKLVTRLRKIMKSGEPMSVTAITKALGKTSPNRVYLQLTLQTYKDVFERAGRGSYRLGPS